MAYVGISRRRVKPDGKTNNFMIIIGCCEKKSPRYLFCPSYKLLDQYVESLHFRYIKAVN